MHIFNPSTQEAEASGSEFKVRLVYLVSSRTGKVMQKDLVSENKTKGEGGVMKEKRRAYFFSISIIS